MQIDLKLDASYLLELIKSGVITNELLIQIKDYLKAKVENAKKKLQQFIVQKKRTHDYVVESIELMKERKKINKELDLIQEKAASFIASYANEFTFIYDDNVVRMEFFNETNSFLKVFSSYKYKILSTIGSFIAEFTALKELKACILHGKNKDEVVGIYRKYMDELRRELVGEKADIEMQEKIYERVEDYILSEVYTRAFPRRQTKGDKYFHTKMLLLRWVDPTALKIRKTDLKTDYWTSACECIGRMEEAKTPKEKLQQVCNCSNLLANGMMKFSKRSEPPGADDLVPFLNYILILAAPKQIYTNLK